MRRREFVFGACVAAAFEASAARAQATAPLLGFLSGRSRAETAHLLAEFHRGLAEAGFPEGQGVRIDYRYADGHYERLPGLAAELVSRGAAAIVTTGGNVTALAAKGATSTIPIVFVAGGDPVGTGLVVSLNRPGGNMTGVSLAIAELAAKRLELLRELMPQVASIAVLGQPRQSRLRRGRARRARPCRSPRRRNPRDLGRGRETISRRPSPPSRRAERGRCWSPMIPS